MNSSGVEFYYADLRISVVSFPVNFGSLRVGQWFIPKVDIKKRVWIKTSWDTAIVLDSSLDRDILRGEMSKEDSVRIVHFLYSSYIPD